jgi:hypothetical protein
MIVLLRHFEVQQRQVLWSSRIGIGTQRVYR